MASEGSGGEKEEDESSQLGRQRDAEAENKDTERAIGAQKMRDRGSRVRIKDGKRKGSSRKEKRKTRKRMRKKRRKGRRGRIQ